MLGYNLRGGLELMGLSPPSNHNALTVRPQGTVPIYDPRFTVLAAVLWSFLHVLCIPPIGSGKVSGPSAFQPGGDTLQPFGA